jgi:hypothetical protein
VACPNPTSPHWPRPTRPGTPQRPSHCWTNGWIDDDIIALFEADTTKYTVTRFPNRQAFNALGAYSPTLYPYLGV